MNSRKKYVISGKGKSGRADTTENTGYVGAYKNKDSYDKTHGK